MNPAVVRVSVRTVSVMNAFRNHIGKISPLTRVTPPPPPPPPPELFNPATPVTPPPPQLAQPPIPKTNPCLDLYYHYRVGPDALSTSNFHESLKQLLPVAWSYNPLTTLKLICNLIDRMGDGGNPDEDAFYAAAIWLHQNHPKTLACNLLSISCSFAHFLDVPHNILFLVLYGRVCLTRRTKQVGQEKLSSRRRSKRDIRFVQQKAKQKAREKASALLNRRKMMDLANKAAERYENDPDYRLLHERVSDLFAECLKSDIEKLQQYHLHHHKDDIIDMNNCLEITSAASGIPTKGFDMLLRESIAKKVYPRESYPEYEGVDEAHYASSVQDRLRKEVLVPLRKVFVPSEFGYGANRWGYHHEGFQRNHEPSATYRYLREVEADTTAYTADALLPHQILDYLADGGNAVQVGEPQWNGMVEDVYLKQGKLKNCLAVCDDHSCSEWLGLLVSQLSEEPWKGKVVGYCKNPRLHLIQGNDLNSKIDSIENIMEGYEFCEIDLVKLFGLILEVAVNENLKPEQMIKKVFVSTRDKDFTNCWESPCDYEEIQSKFKAKGYTMPHLVIWNMWKPKYAPGRWAKPEPGVTLLSGCSKALIKLFLENDGEVGPDHVMEGAISRPAYQTLAVVD